MSNWLVCACVALIILADGRVGGGEAGPKSGRSPRGRCFVPTSTSEHTSPAFEGEYANPDFCYSVRIPAPLKGYEGNPETSKGLGFSLPPVGSIYVGAQPNSFDVTSSAEEARRRIQAARSMEGELISADVSRAHLGALPATRLTMRYRCETSPGINVEDAVVALSGGSIYEVTLYTRADVYGSQRPAMDRLVSGWQYRPDETNPRCVVPPSPPR